MIKGLTVHTNIARAFNFLNLPGFQYCHEYHYLSESRSFQKFSDFFLNHYNKLLNLTIENSAIIPSTWYKYTKQDVDINTKKNAIKDLYQHWINWESETHNLLQEKYAELTEMKDIIGAQKILQLLLDVENELQSAKSKQLSLEAINYDLISIEDRQQFLCAQYKEAIKCLD